MSLKEGAKLSITFNSKRITRSESKLVGLSRMFDGCSPNLLSNVDQSTDLIVRVVARSIILLEHMKMYKNAVANENFQIHGMIGYTVMFFSPFSGLFYSVLSLIYKESETIGSPEHVVNNNEKQKMRWLLFL